MTAVRLTQWWDFENAFEIHRQVAALPLEGNSYTVEGLQWAVAKQVGQAESREVDGDLIYIASLIHAVDYSPECLEASAKFCRDAMDKANCIILQMFRQGITDSFRLGVAIGLRNIAMSIVHRIRKVIT